MKINSIQDVKSYLKHKGQVFITDNLSFNNTYHIDIYNVSYINVRDNYVSLLFTGEKQLYELELNNMETYGFVFSICEKNNKTAFNIKIK